MDEIQSAMREHENIEWTIAYAYGLTDETRNLPRVLLVGDSICKGYQEAVRERLKGRMNVSFWASSYCVTSPAYLPLLSVYLDEAKYDVVHFNNGLHSFPTSLDDYAKGFRAALELVRKRQPGAKIVWCSATPVRDAAKMAKCRELNATAAKVAAEFGADATDDLFAFCCDFDLEAAWSDGTHFRPEAIERQAEQVASSVLVAARPATSAPASGRSPS